MRKVRRAAALWTVRRAEGAGGVRRAALCRVRRCAGGGGCGGCGGWARTVVAARSACCGVSKPSEACVPSHILASVGSPG